MGISTAWDTERVNPSQSFSLLKSPSSRIYSNSYWLPLQDKCKSHSLIFTIYQDAAAHFQQEISLTRTQTPLHLNSIFIVRHSLSSGRGEKSCLSRGESWSKRGRWGESKALLARHRGMTKCQMEGRKVGRWKIAYEYIKLRAKIFWIEKGNGFTRGSSGDLKDGESNTCGGRL